MTINVFFKEHSSLRDQMKSKQGIEIKATNLNLIEIHLWLNISHKINNAMKQKIIFNHIIYLTSCAVFIWKHLNMNI